MVREVRSGRDAQTAPGAAVPAAVIGPVRQARAVHHNRTAWSLIGLKMAGDVLRSRRSQELAIVGAIMVAALAHGACQSQAQMLARLIAWDKRREQALRRHLSAGLGQRKTR